MTLTEAFQEHVAGMDQKDRREAAHGFMFMQFDTLRRRGLTPPEPKTLRPVIYVHAFMDRFTDEEIIEFKPTISVAKRP